MRYFIRSFTIKDFVFIGIMAVCYFMLILQSYPISSDDFIYHFSQRTLEGYEQWTYPISTFKELILSNVEGYLYGNGRFLVHCFVQFCLNNYTFFYMGSTLMFAMLLMSLTYLVRLFNTPRSGDIIYVVSALFCFVPLMSTLCYGTVAMTINYMWSAAIYTFFISVYLHIKEYKIEYSLPKNILLLMFGLICGSWQESFGIGIAGALCIYHLITIKKTKSSLLYLLIGFGLGSAILVFAPSNFIRASASNGDFELFDFIYRSIQIIKYNLFSIFWILIGLISVIVDFFKTRKITFILDNWLYFASGLIAFLFTLFTIAKGVYQGEWQMTILSIWSAILLLRFVKYYFRNKYYVCYHVILYLVIVILLGLYSYIYYYRSVMQKEMSNFTTEFLHNKPDTIYDGKLHQTITCEIPSHKFVFEKICPMYLHWLDLKTYNRMARFYTEAQETWGSAIFPEPIDSIVARCIEDRVVYHTPMNYTVIRMPKGEEVDNLRLNTYTTSKYPFDKFKDMLRGRKEKMIETSLISLPIGENNDYTYYIMYIDWWRFHNRKISHIELVEK